MLKHCKKKIGLINVQEKNKVKIQRSEVQMALVPPCMKCTLKLESFRIKLWNLRNGFPYEALILKTRSFLKKDNHV